MIEKASSETINEQYLNIFGTAAFSNTDGPGSRSVVFFQGCHIGCPWCHSPHSRPGNSPLLFNADFCIACGRCVSACLNGVHNIKNDLHCIDRTKCLKCGKCVSACPHSTFNREASALYLPTRRISIPSLFEQLPLSISDGITLNGGEALLQTEAAVSLLRLCKKNGIHTAVETSGLLDMSCYIEALPYVDVWLFGVRVLTDINGQHKTDTLIDVINLIQTNSNASIMPRIPMIPCIMDKQETLYEINRVLKKIGADEIWLNPWNRHFMHYYNLSGIKSCFSIPEKSEIYHCESAMKSFFTEKGYKINTIT